MKERTIRYLRDTLWPFESRCWITGYLTLRYDYQMCLTLPGESPAAWKKGVIVMIHKKLNVDLLLS